ncbi:M16 family metallopeptidase [Vibrio alfacsensis]|uniref:M16 family metallopeptidase n=1 Tax=Vibrio TaxID=662 RepID=UPI0040687A18
MATKKLFACFLLGAMLLGCKTTLIDQSFTADTSWQTITLDNGLILHIKEVPGEAVSTRLLVRTGSRDEADDQKGYAHFLEHMAFNGSESFPKNEIVVLFGEDGVAFGQHLNAFTTHANTVYQVDLPSDDKLTNALTWFREIATSLSLDPEEVSKERGVVLGEMRSRFQAHGNPDFEIYQLIAEQLYDAKGYVIGNEDSIQNISERRLRDFYQTHYTPNRSEIFIAGDVDSTSVITEVDAIFGQWSAPEKGAPTKNISPLKRSNSTVLGGNDGSFPSTTLLLDLGANPMVSAADFEDFAAASILSNAISTRLNDRARDLNVPIQNTHAVLIQWFEHMVMKIHISYEAQDQQKAMQFLGKELATLRDHGLSTLELDAQASAFLKLESTFADNYTARNFAEDHVFFRMIGRQTLSPETYKSLSEDLVNRADKAWFNKRLTSLLESDDIQTLVTIDRHNFFTEARQEQLAFVSDMEKTFKQSGKALILPEVLSDFPQPSNSGEIVLIEKLDPSTTKWQLSNEVTVYLRHMPNAGDEVHVYAGSKGGLAALSPSLRPAGDLIVGAYAESGLGGFSSNDYNRLMLKENAYLEPIIWEHLHGFYGASTKASLPLVLASIYQGFQHATLDEEMFARYKTQFITGSRQYLESADGKAFKAVSNAIYDSDSVRHTRALDEYEKVTSSDVKLAYEHLMKTNRGMVYVIAGDIAVDELKPLARKYLAAMTFNELSANELYQVKLDPNDEELTIAFGPAGNNVELFSMFARNAKEKTTKDYFLADIAGRIVTSRLTEQVREFGSLDYSPHSFVIWPEGADTQQLFIVINSSLIKRKEARTALNQIVNSIGNGATIEEFNSTTKQLSHALQDGLSQPKEQARMMFNYVLTDADPLAVVNPDSVIDSLSQEDINQYLKAFTSKTATRIDVTNLPSGN